MIKTGRCNGFLMADSLLGLLVLMMSVLILAGSAQVIRTERKSVNFDAETIREKTEWIYTR